MKRRVALGAVLAGVLAAGFGAAQVPAQAPVVKGCVGKEGPADLGALSTVRRLVKVAGPGGAYRTTLEVEGVALRDVLGRAEVRKKAEDGFRREIDTLVVVRGSGGARAVFSWGELFAREDCGAVLAERARWYLPTHHDPIEAAVFDVAAFRGPAARVALDLKACKGCHEGPKPPRLDMPRGVMLAVPGDGIGGRFVEEVTEVEVLQAGVKAVENREAKEKGFVEAPTIVGLDGKEVSLAAERLAALARREAADATIGMGRGFHGSHRWEGVDLGAALRPSLPSDVDVRHVWVLVTALDGYRALYSGSEVFAPRRGEGILLADREDSQPLGPGSGRFKTIATGDFFIDRGVRLVREIRLGLVK